MLETLTLGIGLSDVISNAWYFFLVLLGFCVIIFAHELGHFITAKLVGIRVDVFAIGFGPRLIGIKRGGTDYCLRAIPFGGYVKMLGQEDAALDQDRVFETRHDPESFLAKTPGQRMLVVSGGVVMNVIFAVLAFVVIFMHGLPREAPIVGRVTRHSAAEQAGVQSGDRIRSINGSGVLHFREIQLAITLAEPDSPIDIGIERDGKIVHANVKPVWNRDKRMLMIGLAMARQLTIDDPGLRHADRPQLNQGDRIVKVDDMAPTFFYQVEDALRAARGKPVKLLVERGTGEHVTIDKRAYLVIRPDVAPGVQQSEPILPSQESVLGLQPRCKFLRLWNYAPDRADTVWPLDIVVRVANTVNPSKQELADYFRERRNEMVELVVLRDGRERRVTLDLPRKKPDLAAVISQIGVDDENAVVADVLPDSPAAKLKIPRGATITACNGQAVADWCDIVNYLRDHRGEPVELAFQFGDSTFTGTLDVPADTPWDQNIMYALDIDVRPMQTIIQTNDPAQALALGIRETWYWIKLVYVMLQRITIDKSVDARQVGGPILIFHMGKTVAEAGLFKLLYFFALISANLAVINFLPIPITDGGTMLLLLYEKVRGKPVPPKATAIWQGVGLALIAMVFVAITYNDIRRIITGE